MLENRFKPSHFFLQASLFLLFQFNSLGFPAFFSLLAKFRPQKHHCSSRPSCPLCPQSPPHSVPRPSGPPKPRLFVPQVEKGIFQLLPLQINSDSLSSVWTNLSYSSTLLFTLRARSKAIRIMPPKVLPRYPTTCPSFRLLLLLLPWSKSQSRSCESSNTSGVLSVNKTAASS